MKTTFLLGAGASVEAGMPISVDLTRKIVEGVEQRMGDRDQLTRVLNVAVGAMVAHDTARGAGAYDGIDVERLVSAIQMLRDIDDLEVTPFVSSWSENLTSSVRPDRLPAFFGKNFAQGVMDSPFHHSLEANFREGVQALVGRGNFKDTFFHLEKEMVRCLLGILDVQSQSVNYLQPILDTREDGPVQVASLNYDRGMEVLAEDRDAVLTTGIDHWRGGFKWFWRDEDSTGGSVCDVRLLKLHGSVDWVSADVINEAGWDDEIILHSEDAYRLTHEQRRKIRVGSPALIFGRRGKLRSDGPFLAMLRAFDDFLELTDELVVIGYSFRDDHINAAIKRWFSSRTDTAVTLIDPYLAGDGSHLGRYSPFLDDLIQAMHEGRMYSTGYKLNTRHNIIAAGAGEGLQSWETTRRGTPM